MFYTYIKSTNCFKHLCCNLYKYDDDDSGKD